VQRRKQTEAALRRQQKEHEEMARKATTSNMARVQLEKQLKRLTSSVQQQGGELRYAGQQQQQQSDTLSQTQAEQPPPGQLPASLEFGLMNSPESELLRSSYYVRYLKELASKELVRAVGLDTAATAPAASPTTTQPGGSLADINETTRIID
jgi:hypothetical protein